MLLAALLPSLSLALCQDPVFADRTLVIINDTVITSNDVTKDALRLSNGALPSQDERGRSLQGLVRDAFMDIGFRKTIGSPEVLDVLAADEIKKLAEKAGSLSKLSARLARQGRTIADETRSIRRQYAGLFFLQTELGNAPVNGSRYKAKVHVSPQEMRDYFEAHKDEFQHEARVRARLIVVRDDESGTGKERLTALREDILAEKISFADAAREHSLYKPTIGGSTGHIKPDEASLQKPIRDYLANSAEGQMSEPLDLQGTWAMVLTESIQEKGFTPFKDAQLEISMRLSSQQRVDLQQQALNRIAKQCYIWSSPEIAGLMDRILGIPAEEEL